MNIKALAALLIFSACTRGGTAAKEPESACSLVPQSTAENVLGVKLKPGAAQAFGENPRQMVISNCLYVGVDTDAIKTLSVTIRAGSVADGALNPAESHIITMKQEFGERYELKKLDGLGQGAVWDPSLKQLSVFKGTSTYVWAVAGAEAENLEEKMVALARQTLPDV